jgi:SAM-dependent methyltransferase
MPAVSIRENVRNARTAHPRLPEEQRLRLLPDITRRAGEPELMDDLSIGGPELAVALRQLRLINRLLGAAWPTVEGVDRLWRAAGRPGRLSVLDVGAGSGESALALQGWARLRGVELYVALLDIHPETCAAAARHLRGAQGVGVVCGDVLRLPLRGADVVTASLFTHHLGDELLAAALTAMAGAARLGVVVNDLHRSRLAWALITLATRALSRNRMIRHDAPLSVLKGFRARELAALRDRPGLAGLWFGWRPFFRWLMILPGGAQPLQTFPEGQHEAHHA